MDLYELLNWVYYLFFLVILIPVGIAYSRWPSVPKGVRWVVMLLTTLLIIEIVSTVTLYNHIRNHFLYYFRTLVILWFGAAFYTYRFGKKICYTAALLVSVCMLAEIALWVGFNHINSISLSISKSLLALGAFSTLRQLMAEEPTKPLWVQADLFIQLGLLIFGFFSVVTDAFKSQFIDSSINLYYFFDTLAVMINAVAFITLARGFWLVRSDRSVVLSR